jgi:hypothetical protein
MIGLMGLMGVEIAKLAEEKKGAFFPFPISRKPPIAPR